MSIKKRIQRAVFGLRSKEDRIRVASALLATDKARWVYIGKGHGVVFLPTIVENQSIEQYTLTSAVHKLISKDDDGNDLFEQAEECKKRDEELREKLYGALVSK